MAVEEKFERVGIRAGEDYRRDKGRNGSLPVDARTYDAKAGEGPREPLPRAGSPLPMGTSGRPLSGRSEGQGTRANSPQLGRAMSISSHSEGETQSGMQWMMGVMKQAAPFVQKLLPLLDGQIATAVANMLSARPNTPPPQRVDLEPLENGLADLQIQHANIKDQLADQSTALKRVEDRLEMVREATDRNTLEQQELIEDLKTISHRMNRIALLFLVLLVLSVLVNISLFLHIQRVLP